MVGCPISLTQGFLWYASQDPLDQRIHGHMILRTPKVRQPETQCIGCGHSLDSCSTRFHAHHLRDVYGPLLNRSRQF